MIHSQLLPILVLLLAAAADLLILQGAAAAAMARDGCIDKCGNITIPFPFGMNKPECFLPGFEVTCDSSSRVFLAFKDGGKGTYQEFGDFYSANGEQTSETTSGPVELIDISLSESETRAYGMVTFDCSTNATEHRGRLQATILEGPFLLAATRNVLVGVGGNVTAKLVSSLSLETATDTTDGYLPSCSSNLGTYLQFATNGSCAGQGCCQAALPSHPPIDKFAVMFEFKNNPSWKTTPCNYGMLVESQGGTPRYNFSTPDLYGDKVLSKKNPRGVPFVIDFAIRGGGSCQKPPKDYACVSGNSSCANATFGEGYVCKCWKYYGGNPYLPNGCQDIDECEQNPCSSGSICKNKVGGYDCVVEFPLAAKIVVGLAGLIVVFVLMVMTHQLLKLKRFYEQNGGPLLKGVKNIRIYTRKQLKQISNNYKRVIGEGHFGKVYLGTLGDKQQVAIKKSIKVDTETKKEFTDEVIIQSEMRHKNIVRLLGCCLQMDVPMLVYEFVVKGSLYDVLFGRRDSITVDTRLRIAIGSAEGLAYMHSAGESTIRHGDVKSANILLDDNFTPKVSDFGTSKLLARGIAEKTERVIGDMSYIDPIYMEKGVVTQKNDVYSFGVVLIELITRRPAKYDDQRSYVANFVQASLDNRAREFIDNDITREEDIKLLDMASAVAVECLEPNPEDRPDMKQVEQRLAHIIGQSTQPGQEINYQGNLSPTLADVALLKAGEERSTY